MMRRRLSVLVLVAATFTGSWSLGMAAAEPVDPRLVLTDVGSAVATSIEIDRMYPGLAVTRPYEVGLTATAPDARLALDVAQLVDLERGCNQPETTSGDDTCGEFDGEMSQQLLVSAVLTSTAVCQATAEATEILPPTPLAEVATAGTVDADTVVRSGTSRCLLLTFDLPRSADNLVQTDLARFDLTVHGAQAFPDDTGTEGDGTDVAGVAVERPAPVVSAPTGVGPNLPVTGADLGLLLATALGGLAAGGLALRASRRSRPAPTPDDHD